MATAYDVGVRILKYTGYTSFTYLFGFAAVFILLFLHLIVFSLLISFAAIILILNLLLYLYSHRNMEAFENKRLEFFCAILPALITPLGSYIIGGVLMTLEGPPLSARRELN